MSVRQTLRVFTVPPSADFLAELARAVLRGGFPTPETPPPGPADLARWTILVPTRRAARALEQIFLDVTAARAMVLPAIRPIGDVDEDLLDIHEPPPSPAEIAIDPAISGLGRDFLLTSLLTEWANGMPGEPLAREIIDSPLQALNLARVLGRLVDDCEARGIELTAAVHHYQGELPVHREALLAFLDVLITRYPARLHEMSLIGAIRRRSRLIEMEAERLRRTSPAYPVIAAGSTGSIAATASLLRVIAGLDQGAVVLPGLDQDMDSIGWNSLGDPADPHAPAHPQFGMFHLLQGMGLERGQVKLLPGLTLSTLQRDRAWLVSEIMRPTATAEAWRDAMAENYPRVKSALSGVELLEAGSPRDEASQLALCIRAHLAEKDRTVALVTPDRELALRVRTELARWRIDADDSAGMSLARTPQGSLFTLLLALLDSPHDPGAWASLVHHPLARFGAGQSHSARAAVAFDLVLLRYRQWRGDVRALPGLLADARKDLAADRHAHAALKRLTVEDFGALESLVESVRAVLGPLLDLAGDGTTRPLRESADAVIEAYDSIVGPETAWSGFAGEGLSAALIAIRQEADLYPRSTFAKVVPILADIIRRGRVRTPLRGGARLAILGLLEARLVRADVTILAGLNEGTWPKQPDAGPWLNRPMRRDLGLDSPEREIGLAAHDFAEAFGAPRVVLSWSRRIAGAPATPSRWLLRLRMLMKAAGQDTVTDSDWQSWAKAFDKAAEVTPASRPMPRPRVSISSISVSQVEKLYRDPYAIYAEKILGLAPLSSYAGRPEASERGLFVHAALEEFTRKFARAIPDDAVNELREIGLKIFGPRMRDPDISSFWWPRFCRIAAWFVEEDRRLRADVEACLVEKGGSLTLDVAGAGTRLSGRADRIDLLKDGTVRIIDYKTGTFPSPKQVMSGYAPQLPLEAALIGRGAFNDVPPRKTSSLLYMKLSGGDPPGKSNMLEVGPVMDLAEEHLQILATKLTQLFAGAEAWLPRRAMRSTRDISEYDHLSRFAEWGAR
jgi:ATP-dependent helicase/nuclease subunit B